MKEEGKWKSKWRRKCECYLQGCKKTTVLFSHLRRQPIVAPPPSTLHEQGPATREKLRVVKLGVDGVQVLVSLRQRGVEGMGRDHVGGGGRLLAGRQDQRRRWLDLAAIHGAVNCSYGGRR